MIELGNALSQYLEYVSTYLDARLGRSTHEGQGLVQVSPIPAAIRAWFEECEKSSSWLTLVQTCAQIFSQEGHSKADWGYEQGLKNWLRRNGTYMKLLDGVRPAVGEVADALAGGLRTMEDHVVLLALLERVHLAKYEMDFGDFQIVRPTTQELESLLSVPVNRIFYPWAATSTNRLTNHWYLQCESCEPRPRLGWIVFEGMFSGPVLPVYTEFQLGIERFLKRMVLSPQLGKREEFARNGWLGFSVPFIIVSRDNPFQAPPAAPPISKLLYEYGEENGEQPEIWFRLGAQETERFEAIIRSVNAQLHALSPLRDQWTFLDLGLSYLVKGYFADGLEQLLWHIVAIEALLGEKGTGVTKRLSSRIGKMCSHGATEVERTSRSFSELYDLRCSLVHGRPFGGQVHGVHLWNARELARAVGTTMLNLLSRLAEEVNSGRLRHVPSREEILEVLDLEEEPRRRFVELLRAFPRIKGLES